MARAYTVEEMRTMFIKQMEGIVRYWENEDRVPTSKEKLEGALHSILVLFDGGNAFMPAFDIIPAPHTSDKQYCIDNDENYWEEKVINECQLHDEWHAMKKEKK